jgi:hypothetical protein
VFKILHYSEMECNCVRKFITEELFRNYSTLWQHRCECPLTVLTIVCTLAGDPVEPIGKFGTEVHCVIKTESLNNDGQQLHQYQQNKQPCCRGFCFINVICSYLHIPVSNTMSVSYDMRVDEQQHDRCH